jgi:solute carrier family 25 aspartate/glutamate transporter 12/13
MISSLRPTADENGVTSIPMGMLSGGLAGMCQVVATNPMEIVKIRLQVERDLNLCNEKRS